MPLLCAARHQARSISTKPNPRNVRNVPSALVTAGWCSERRGLFSVYGISLNFAWVILRLGI